MYENNPIYEGNKVVGLFNQNNIIVENNKQLSWKLRKASIYPIVRISGINFYLKAKIDGYFALLQAEKDIQSEEVKTEIKSISEVIEQEDKIKEGTIAAKLQAEEDIQSEEQYAKYLTGIPEADEVIISGGYIGRDRFYVLGQVVDFFPKGYGENEVRNWIRRKRTGCKKYHDTIFFYADKVDDAIVDTDFKKLLSEKKSKPLSKELVKKLKEKGGKIVETGRTGKDWQEVIDDAKRKEGIINYIPK